MDIVSKEVRSRMMAGIRGSNTSPEMKVRRLLHRHGFRYRLHQKDLRNALLAAESMKVSLPFTSLAQQVLMALMNGGRGDLDHSAIATFIEDMAKVEIKKP